MKGKGGTELVGPWGYFEVAEVAIMLGASERTIRRAIAAGKIDCYRISPRKSWISWADAEKWWAKRGGRTEMSVRLSSLVNRHNLN